MEKIKAFTMAEVLITLGIIGIVACMTMPGVIKNYQKKVTVECLKQTYSMLQQAVMLSEVKLVDEGAVRPILLERCKTPRSVDQQASCGALIMYDGWEIRDDYPWR